MITIEQLQANIRAARAQAEQHHADSLACHGAAQAYELLLSQLIQEKRLADASNAIKTEDKAPVVDAPVEDAE